MFGSSRAKQAASGSAAGNSGDVSPSSASGGSKSPNSMFADESKELAAGELPTPGSVFDASFIRERYIEQQLAKRQSEFTEKIPLRIHFTSWNVNGKKPPNEDISSILATEEEPPEMFVFGLQEIVDLNATNLVVDHNASEAWEALIEETLKRKYPAAPFVLLSSRHLVGIALMIWIRRELRDRVQDLLSDTAGVGIMGVGGNKGGVAIRMKLFDSTVCFVNSHLAAHQNNVQGRNADFHNVCKKLQFQLRRNDDEKPTTANVFAHDFLFWIGDLNYRLNVTDLGIDEVHRRIEAGNHLDLLEYDQLILEKRKGTAFARFEEPPIDFRPTYKYQAGTQLYERRPDKKIRFPAWCDRIQWLVAPGAAPVPAAGQGQQGPPSQQQQQSRASAAEPEDAAAAGGAVVLAVDAGEQRDEAASAASAAAGESAAEANQLKQPEQAVVPPVQSLWYRRTEQVLSDHKPVIALLLVQGSRVLADCKRRVYQELSRQLDAWENECIPKVDIEPAVVDFGDVYFDTPATHRLRISNTGQVVVRFHFSPKLKEQDFCKPWLRVEPQYGMIPPGESMEVELTVHVSRQNGLRLNTGVELLDDILIFRLENGRDYFVSTAGRYMRSCFGSSIQNLVNTPVPVREADPRRSVLTRALSLPKELWRMVDHLWRSGGLDTEGLFTEGKAQEIETIRECLDTGREFPEGLDPLSMAEALVLFFQSLSEPVFPMSLVNQYSDSMNLTVWCKQALMQLHAAKHNTFIYIVAFLREVLKHERRNGATVDRLVLVFSGCLMHAPPPHQAILPGPAARGRPSGRPKFWRILHHFLVSDEFAS